jgi:hypothetical protein
VDDEHDRFAALAGTPYLWQHAAREYIVAANYLLDWYDVSRATPEAARFEFSLRGIAPVMVLYAIAVENLLKAIRVAVNGTPVVDGELAVHFKHHNLLAHAKQVGLTLSDRETDLLEHLGDLLEAGRYPVPVGIGKTPRAWWFGYPRDVEAVWSLLERLEGELRATGQDVLPDANLRERYRPIGYGLWEKP